jgi:hypothetical protein
MSRSLEDWDKFMAEVRAEGQRNLTVWQRGGKVKLEEVEPFVQQEQTDEKEHVGQVKHVARVAGSGPGRIIVTDFDISFWNLTRTGSSAA